MRNPLHPQKAISSETRSMTVLMRETIDLASKTRRPGRQHVLRLPGRQRRREVSELAGCSVAERLPGNFRNGNGKNKVIPYWKEIANRYAPSAT
jgi:hypothetical protein